MDMTGPFRSGFPSLFGNTLIRAITCDRDTKFPLANAVCGMRIIDAVFRSAESGGWEAV